MPIEKIELSRVQQTLFGYSLWGLADPHQLERWNPQLVLVEDTPPLPVR